MRVNVPQEEQEQITLFKWAEWSAGKLPELRLLHHIPNGGKRSKSEAARLKAEGVKSGVPDLCLPVARGGYHGLYIELKRLKGGELSDNQRGWLEDLRTQGYAAYMCCGWEEARDTIVHYLKQMRED